MTCLEGDLSGKKQLNVHVWLKMGEGDGVVTGVRIQKAPMNHANSAVAKVSSIGRCRIPPPTKLDGQVLI